MKKSLDNKNWKRLSKGAVITDCSLISHNIIYLCLREERTAEEMISVWEDELTTKLLELTEINKNEPLDTNYLASTGFIRPVIGVAHKPQAVGLIASNDMNGTVEIVRGEIAWSTEYIAKGKYPFISRIKCLFGYAWSVGSQRNVYKRIDTNTWIAVDNGLIHDGELFDLGFEDIDGFSENDIYAVGGKGDVWHYDGTIWTQCDFPCNKQLNCIVCAPDGNVYIGGQAGSLWQGRENTWTKIYDGEFTGPWNDLVWFQNQLWLCSDYLLRVWDNNQLQPVKDPVDGSLMPLSGAMAANEENLIVATYSSVWSFDGAEWICIVQPYDD